MSYTSQPLELFNNTGTSLSQLLQQGLARAESKVNTIPIDELVTIVAENVMDELIDSLNLVVPELDLENKTISKEEKIGGGSTREPRLYTRFLYSFPFTGNKDFFYCAPERHSLFRLTRAIVNGGTLQLIFDFEDLTKINVEARYGTEIGQVQQNLAFLKPEIEEIKRKIRAHGNALFFNRVARENQANEILEALKKTS